MINQSLYQSYINNAANMSADDFINQWLNLYSNNGYMCLFGMNYSDNAITNDEGKLEHKYRFFCTYNKLFKPDKISTSTINTDNVNLHWSCQTFGFRRITALPPRTSKGPMTPEERAERKLMPKQTFLTLKRGKNYVQNLESVVVDMDLKDCLKAGVTMDNFMEHLPDMLAYNNIPMPTMIVRSGHGFHLYFKIHSLFFANNIYLWTLVSKFICKALKRFGADPKIAGDSSRVLKLPGTINRKPNKPDETVSGVFWSGIIYDLNWLAEQFCLSMYDTELPEVCDERDYNKIDDVDVCRETGALICNGTDPRSVRFLAKARLRRRRIHDEYLEAKKQWYESVNINDDITYSGKVDNDAYDGSDSEDGISPVTRSYIKKGLFGCKDKKYARVYIQRRHDLEKLLHMRDMEDSGRESILFIYRYNECLITNDAETALNNTIALNNSLNNPLPEEELLACTVMGEIYAFDEKRQHKFSNKWIVESNNITDEEAVYMKQLLTPAVKKSRRQSAQRNQYLKKTGKDMIHTLTEKLAEFTQLISQGIKSCKDMCAAMGISKSTFYRLKKTIKEQQADIPATNIKKSQSEASRPAEVHIIDKIAALKEKINHETVACVKSLFKITRSDKLNIAFNCDS